MIDEKEVRRLLELAAKAAGLPVQWEPTHACFWIKFGYGLEVKPWDPYHDDGDSRRLEVALKMEVDHNHPADDTPWVSVRAQGQRCCAVEEFDDEGQRCVATRMAVLRAAAAVGESMQGGAA